jgi:CBS domain-containing protein
MYQEASERHGLVSNWMTRAPILVSEDCSIRRALSRMQGEGIRHLLVVDGDRLIGIVSNRDVRRLALENPNPALLSQPICSIMTEGPVTVAPEMAVTAAARLLLEHKIGALPVRDGDTIVGIFSTGDALEALLAALEHGDRDARDDHPVTSS